MTYDDLIARAEHARIVADYQERLRAATYPRCAWCGEPTPGNAGNGRTPICAGCYSVIAAEPRMVRRLHRGE